jgi:phosphoribosyl-dephospho-CoA transferase
MSYKRSLIKFTIAIFGIILLSNLSTMVNSQAVCSLDELIKELYEDIVDNGKQKFLII